MYGLQDPERPVTAGWIVSSGFELGRQSFVVEGAWHRDAYVLEHPWGFEEVFREKLQNRYWMLMGGVRGGERQGRVAPYYQVLAGGFAGRFRRDYEWPTSIDTEAENAAWRLVSASHISGAAASSHRNGATSMSVAILVKHDLASCRAGRALLSRQLPTRPLV